MFQVAFGNTVSVRVPEALETPQPVLSFSSKETRPDPDGTVWPCAEPAKRRTMSATR